MDVNPDLASKDEHKQTMVMISEIATERKFIRVIKPSRIK
jgi:hypothetical protein